MGIARPQARDKALRMRLTCDIFNIKPSRARILPLAYYKNNQNCFVMKAFLMIMNYNEIFYCTEKLHINATKLKIFHIGNKKGGDADRKMTGQYFIEITACQNSVGVTPLAYHFISLHYSARRPA